MSSLTSQVRVLVPGHDVESHSRDFGCIVYPRGKARGNSSGKEGNQKVSDDFVQKHKGE